MKKNIISLLLIPVIVLSGCTKKNSTDELKVSANSKEPYYVDKYCNIYENGLIYHDKNNGTLRYLNFDTMESTVFCSKPNCSHNTSECIAKMIEGSPFIYNNYMYFFDAKEGINETSDGSEFFIDSKLKKVSLETSEIEVVSEFTDCEPDSHGGYFVIDGNMIYFCGNDMNPKKDEFGGISYANGGGEFFVCSINLDTGEYTNYGSIYNGEEYPGMDQSASVNLRGIYNNKIYIENSFMKEYDDSFDCDPRDKFTILNFEFDLKTHEIKQSELPDGSHMGDDFYVYSNYPEISTTILEKDKKYIVEGADAKTIGKYFNGRLFILDKWYDIADGSCHSLGEEYSDFRILTTYDKYYIFATGGNGKFLKLTEEELLALG